jgi:hypothetical protein
MEVFNTFANDLRKYLTVLTFFLTIVVNVKARIEIRQYCVGRVRNKSKCR